MPKCPKNRPKSCAPNAKRQNRAEFFLKPQNNMFRKQKTYIYINIYIIYIVVVVVVVVVVVGGEKGRGVWKKYPKF